MNLDTKILSPNIYFFSRVLRLWLRNLIGDALYEISISSLYMRRKFAWDNCREYGTRVQWKQATDGEKNREGTIRLVKVSVKVVKTITGRR